MEEPSPHAPWALSGQAIVSLVPRTRVLGTLGQGLAPLPGPGVLIAVSNQVSPIGPYCTLSLLEPARLRGRPGWSVTLSVVNDRRAWTGGRLNWGFPGQVGALTWSVNDEIVRMDWAEGGLVVTAERRRGIIPVAVRLRLLQRRADGEVGVPVRLRGIARLADIEIRCDPAAGAVLPSGEHRGAVLSSQRLQIRPAARPAGMVRTLMLPLRPPEPGVAGPILVQHPAGGGRHGALTL